MAAVNPSANMVVLHVRSPMNAFCFPFFFQEERLAGFMPRRGYAVCMVHGEVRRESLSLWHPAGMHGQTRIDGP
jgi:hypothetical protein